MPYSDAEGLLLEIASDQAQFTFVDDELFLNADDPFYTIVEKRQRPTAPALVHAMADIGPRASLRRRPHLWLARPPAATRVTKYLVTYIRLSMLRNHRSTNNYVFLHIP